MEEDIWAPLTAELDRWQGMGKVARFWLRDDDAVEPTPALERLLAITAHHSTPLALAVIPAHTGRALADHLLDTPFASVVVHGWSHVNHAGVGEKKQELGAHRPAAGVAAELAAGFELLERLHPDRFVPMLVPPWNRIAPEIVEQLPGIGFKALSVFGREKVVPIRLINTHVDLMDWHGTRGGREHAALVADIVGRLRQMDETGGTMGLLTHHLVHDETAWLFVDRLLRLTKDHPACQWASLPELVAGSG